MCLQNSKFFLFEANVENENSSAIIEMDPLDYNSIEKSVLNT